MPWLLGSSPQSAIWAGELGLRYAFADFINPNGGEIARLYRDRFACVRDLQAPRTAVAAWVRSWGPSVTILGDERLLAYLAKP